jgi:uncharacterized membrane-anchored protein
MSPLYLCDGLGLQTRAACVLVHRVSLENEARQAALHEGITKVERDMERLLRTLKEREQVRDEADLPSIRRQGGVVRRVPIVADVSASRLCVSICWRYVGFD